MAERLAEIEARLEELNCYQDEPPCTCTQTDVDFYDTSGCDLCNRRSDWNRGMRNAAYQIELHGVDDITYLVAEVKRLRHESTVKRAE